MERYKKSIGGFFMRNIRLQKMVEAAFMATIALLLDLLPSIQLGPWISISFAMVPIFLIAYRWGLGTGILSGFIWAMLQLAIGDADIVHPIQFILEYPIAFSAIGLAGVFAGHVKQLYLAGNRKKGSIYLVFGVLVGSLARYFCHYLAGIIWFGSYAPEGQPAWLYSLIINGTTWVGAFIFCAVVLILLLGVGPRLLKTNHENNVEISS